MGLQVRIRLEEVPSSMMKKSNAAALLLILGLVAVFSLAHAAETNTTSTDAPAVWQWHDNKATVTMTLDVTLGVQGFKSMMSELQRQAALTTTKPHIEKRPVLGKQKAKPDNWAHVTVKGQAGIQSTLAIRLDNLYLVGFKTGASWYAFKGKDHLIQGAIPLGFKDDYKSLTGGSHLNLKEVAVGKKPAADSLATLASYKPGTTEEKEVKEALLTFVLMVCEGSRFTLVRSEVVAAWDNGGTVGEAAAKLTVKWNTVSCALLRWSKSHKWDSKEAEEIKTLGDPQMKTPADAAANVYCILQVAECV